MSVEELKDKRDELNAQVKELIGKRKKHVHTISQLRKEYQESRKARNIENKAVADLKKQRTEVSKKIKENKKSLADIFESVDSLKDELSGSYHILKKRLERMDWDYQTGVFTIKREKQMVKEMDALERELLASDELREKRGEVHELQRGLRDLYNEANAFHKSLLLRAQESEKNHRKMVELYKKINELSEKITSLDTVIKETREQADEIHMSLIDERKKKMKKEELKRFEKKEKRKELEGEKEEELRKKAKKALESFKNGKKITHEEMQLLEKFDLY